MFGVKGPGQNGRNESRGDGVGSEEWEEAWLKADGDRQ